MSVKQNLEHSLEQALTQFNRAVHVTDGATGHQRKPVVEDFSVYLSIPDTESLVELLKAGETWLNSLMVCIDREILNEQRVPEFFRLVETMSEVVDDS